MNLDILSQADLFNEISDLARSQGVATQEAWEELADETVESHLLLGELDPDQNLVGLKTTLHGLWQEYSRGAGEESMEAIDEDPQAPKA
ncbi:hypothetical protein KKF59_01770 [Patescibacteria group bacterium]|nr:hypothetical protein [Patescibacteria group bacterium]MBU1034534.1 hypothetical protein [Patescibacteria group bacterium]MBU1629487.1 hypothetical protein [Patescibacteria group bacterium]MBU1907841.1 hypothetical protein [Patescibacteria group bacterium]